MGRSPVTTRGGRASIASATASTTAACFSTPSELSGDDLRPDPLEVRKATLASVLANKAGSGLRLNEHIEADGPTVFAHARKLGLEGMVSKRLGSRYRSGRSPDWLKMKNPAAPAVKREAEEEWVGERLYNARTWAKRRLCVWVTRHGRRNALPERSSQCCPSDPFNPHRPIRHYPPANFESRSKGYAQLS